MKHTRKDLSKGKIEIKATVGADELKKAHKTAVQNLAKNVKVKGFRDGKVPLNVAEKHIDPATLANQAVENAINDAMVQILIAEQIQLLDRPKVDLGEFKPFESLEFTATVEIVPPVKLGDYKKLKVTKNKVEISQKEVDEVIDRLLQNAAEKVEVERAAKNGDEVMIDFDGRDEKDEPVKGAKAENYPLTLGTNSFIPGFEEAVVGHKAGEAFDIPLTFPKDYHADALKGAKVTFKIKLHKVNEIKKSELNDDFAKTVGPFTTAAELTTDIKKELTSRAEYDAEEKYKDDLLTALVAKSTVEAPDVLVGDQLQALEQDFSQNLMYRGMSIDQYFESQGYKNRDDWEAKELRPTAEKRVKNGLVLSELSRTWDIRATDEEIDARQADVVSQYNDPKLKSSFESEAARRDIANRIVTEKTLAKLVEEAN